MSLQYFDTLRKANSARQIEWDTGNETPLSYAGNEFAGEVGELMQVTDDLIQSPHASNFPGGGKKRDIMMMDFRHEVADVLICIDLIAARCGIHISYEDLVPITRLPVQDLLILLGIDTGLICNTIKKLERERYGMVGSRGSLDDLRENLVSAAKLVISLAEFYELDGVACVAEKFNLTSEKYGLKTRMGVSNGGD